MQSCGRGSVPLNHNCGRRRAINTDALLCETDIVNFGPRTGIVFARDQGGQERFGSVLRRLDHDPTAKMVRCVEMCAFRGIRHFIPITSGM